MAGVLEDLEEDSDEDTWGGWEGGLPTGGRRRIFAAAA